MSPEEELVMRKEVGAGGGWGGGGSWGGGLRHRNKVWPLFLSQQFLNLSHLSEISGGSLFSILILRWSELVVLCGT